MRLKKYKKLKDPFGFQFDFNIFNGDVKDAAIYNNISDFAENCYIRSGNKLQKFKLYDYQKQLINIIDKYRITVIFKCRQLGVTETLGLYFLYKAIKNPAYSAALISLGQIEASLVAKRIRLLSSQLNNFSWQSESKTNLEPANGGSIKFCPCTDNAIRSLASVNDIFYDEAAFPANISEIFATASPAQEMVGNDARTIIASTMSPMGELSWFWNFFNSDNGDIDAYTEIEKSKKGLEKPFHFWVDENGCAKVIIHFNAHPIYGQVGNYLENTKKKLKLTEATLQREYNLGIPKSSGVLFDLEKIPLIAIGDWKPYQTGHNYILSIDPNFGSDDYWNSGIWDITNPNSAELVAEYHKNNTSVDYSLKKTIELIEQYKIEFAGIESNSGGKVIAEELVKKCPDLNLIEICHNKTSKTINTDRVALAIENLEMTIPKNAEIVAELPFFSLVERKALKGHDDAIMSATVAWAIMDTAREYSAPAKAQTRRQTY